MADIFIRQWFRKRGPYTEEEIRTWLREGKLSLTTPAWRQGMSEWKPLSTWGMLSTPMSLRRRLARNSRKYSYQGGEMVDPGLGRLAYFLFGLILFLLIHLLGWAADIYGVELSNALGKAAQDFEGGDLVSQFIPMLVSVMTGVVALWLGVRRLDSIGWSWYYILPLFVPGIGVFFAMALFALPPGFAATRKLDFSAWVVILIGLALYTGVIASATAVLDNSQLPLEVRDSLEKALWWWKPV